MRYHHNTYDRCTASLIFGVGIIQRIQAHPKSLNHIKGREGKSEGRRREGKEGKGREGKGRAGKGREREGKERKEGKGKP